MIYNLANQIDRQDFKTYCDYLYKLGEETGCVVEISRKKHTRSLRQNAYAHVCIAYFAAEYGITLEEAKYEFFKKRYNPEIFVRKKVNRRGQEITYVRSSANLDTEEFTRAIQCFRNKVAEEIGLYIPDANEYDALLEAQKQIERFKDYL